MADTQEQNQAQGFISRIRKGVVVFALLSVAGLAAVFFYTRTPETLDVLGRLDGRWFAAALGLAGVDFLLGGLRNHIFIRKLQPGTSFWLSVKAHLANMFMAAMTPAQSGGGIAQVYTYHRGGIEVREALSVTVISLLSTIITFLFAGLFGVIVIYDLLGGEVIWYIIQYSFVAVAISLVFFIVALWRPDVFGRTFGWLTKVVARLRPRSKRRMVRWRRRAEHEIQQFHSLSVHLIRHRKSLLAMNLGLTAVMYFNKYLIAYLIRRGLSADAELLQVVAVQALLWFIFYFAPTPGGSGIAELSTGAIMSLIMPRYLLPVFTIIYRFFQVYLPAGVGSLVLMRELAPQALPQNDDDKQSNED